MDDAAHGERGMAWLLAAAGGLFSLVIACACALLTRRMRGAAVPAHDHDSHVANQESINGNYQ
ncbi:hypothetical protein D557_3258 [Bordetella holmesii 70147]|nr:hypothetical protein D557_3258 [Bordetella holmesii 70147]